MSIEIEVNWDKLPQIREDPITGKRIIISAQRGFKMPKKPEEVVAYPPLPKFLKSCPFCLGNEGLIPKILAENAVAKATSNRLPILMIEEGEIRNNHGFYAQYVGPGVGASELVIILPKHNTCFSKASEDVTTGVLQVMIERYFDLKKDRRFRWFFVFQNYGFGASMEHPHLQLMVFARKSEPSLLYTIYQNMVDYRVKHGECFFCRAGSEEEKQGQAGRLITANESFLAYIPFAPSEPFEVRLVPKDHISSFAEQFQNEKAAFQFAHILKEVMGKVKKSLQQEVLGKGNWQRVSDPHYLFRLYTAPYDDDSCGAYHWFFVISPQNTKKVGFERGTDQDVIPIFPEEAAAILRAV